MRESEFDPTLIIDEEEGGSLNRLASNIGAVSWPVSQRQTFFLRFGSGNVIVELLRGFLEAIPSGPPPNDDITNALYLGDSQIVTAGAWMLNATSEEGLPVDDIPP